MLCHKLLRQYVKKLDVVLWAGYYASDHHVTVPTKPKNEKSHFNTSGIINSIRSLSTFNVNDSKKKGKNGQMAKIF